MTNDKDKLLKLCEVCIKIIEAEGIFFATDVLATTLIENNPDRIAISLLGICVGLISYDTYLYSKLEKENNSEIEEKKIKSLKKSN